jgi:uncharacterized membrane protein
MTYAQYGLVQAADYNALTGGPSSTTANTLNVTWATGTGNAGYGQTAEGNVAIGDSVTAGKWANLVNKTSNSATHQGSTISSVSAPVAGGTVTYVSAIPTNLSTIYSNRLNAQTVGSTTANTATRGTTWNTALTFTHTATFANADAARYFFNAGGSLKITCSHPSGVNIDLLFNNLASNVGTVALSSPVSGSISVAGTTYNGVTKVGGGGNAPTISTNSGFYALTTANTTLFTQTASTGPAAYLSTFIRVIGAVNSNASPSVVTLYTVWDEVPDGFTVTSGTATTLTAQAPETTNLANTWGTITLAGSVTGS